MLSAVIVFTDSLYFLSSIVICSVHVFFYEYIRVWQECIISTVAFLVYNVIFLHFINTDRFPINSWSASPTYIIMPLVLPKQPGDCGWLIEKLQSCSNEELLPVLRSVETWSYGKCELYHWIDVLDRWVSDSALLRKVWVCCDILNWLRSCYCKGITYLLFF